MSAKLKCQICGVEFEAARSDVCYCGECRQEVRCRYSRDYDHKHRQDKCPECGSIKGARAKLCKLCNNKQQPWRKVGEENSNWKGGKTTANGYVYIRTKRKSGGAGDSYKAEHHIVWEQHHGQLPKGYVVHHLNGIRDDNRIDNLIAMPRKRHNPNLIIAPHQKRIRQLETQLKELQQLRLLDAT